MNVLIWVNQISPWGLMRTSSWIQTELHISQSAGWFTVTLGDSKPSSITNWLERTTNCWHFNRLAIKLCRPINLPKPIVVLYTAFMLLRPHLVTSKKISYLSTVTAESVTFTIKRQRETNLFQLKADWTGHDSIFIPYNHLLFLFSDIYNTREGRRVYTAVCRIAEFSLQNCITVLYIGISSGIQRVLEHFTT